MRLTPWRAIATLTCAPCILFAQAPVAAWLDQSELASWNRPGLPVPAAPKLDANGDPRCKEQARPPESGEDKRLVNKGWDLIGAYQAGWRTVVIRATAGYDGMCRPLQYQDFVFVRGVFAGTLSPRLMDSRSDGALTRVSFQSNALMAVYNRYAASDPLCCPSRVTTVKFEIAAGPPVVRPLSAYTSSP